MLQDSIHVCGHFKKAESSQADSCVWKSPIRPKRGEFDDREYSVKVMYRGSNQDSDPGDNVDTAGRDKRGLKQETSEREIGHHQHGKPVC